MKLNNLGKQVVADANTYKRKAFTAAPLFIRLMNGEGAYNYEIKYTTEDLTVWESIDHVRSGRVWKAVKTTGEKTFINKHTTKGFYDPKGEFAPNGYADLLNAISED
jgi:hypothetical protein